MKKITTALVALMAAASLHAADNGLITKKSAHSVNDTANRFATIIEEKGITVFARVDHSANAKKVDKDLRPTELIIFGNPKVGTPLMQCSQTTAIDLPQKALVWEDDKGDVWFTYNDPSYLKDRHQLGEQCDKVVEKVTMILDNFSNQATQ